MIGLPPCVGRRAGAAVRVVVGVAASGGVVRSVRVAAAAVMIVVSRIHVSARAAAVASVAVRAAAAVVDVPVARRAAAARPVVIPVGSGRRPVIAAPGVRRGRRAARARRAGAGVVVGLRVGRAPVVMHVEAARRPRKASAPARLSREGSERDEQRQSRNPLDIHFATSSTRPVSDTYVPALVFTKRRTPLGGICADEWLIGWFVPVGFSQTVPLWSGMWTRWPF